jgi:hypothetical protein
LAWALIATGDLAGAEEQLADYLVMELIVDLPVATVSADTAYIGGGMSMWTTGEISTVYKSAAALGVRAGMSTQKAASIMLAEAKTPPEPE